MAYPQDRNFAYQPPPAGYPPPPQGYPPYGAPPSPYPPAGYPPQQYPPQQYPPPPQQGYPPPQGQQYPPPQGYPPQGYPPQQYPPQQYPPQPYPPPQQYPPQGYPPPVQYRDNSYPAPPPSPYGAQPSYLHPGVPQQAPPPPIYHTSPPIAPPIIPTADIEAIRKACKGFNTDEATLIKIFANRDPAQLDAIRAQYPAHTQRDLIATLDKETSGNFRTALKAVAYGPIESGVFFANMSVAGLGTNDAMLTESIMGKTNAEIIAMKTIYPTRYKETLEAAVKGDLSMKTAKLFMMALAGTRMDDWVPVDPQAVARNVETLHNATMGRIGTDELAVCSLLTSSSDSYLRAIAAEYQRKYKLEVTKLIRREFSGHMHDAFLYIMDGALNKPLRDAKLLEDSMKGLGTKDDLLISRLVRARWNRVHFDQVKTAYRSTYGKDLHTRVKGETSGDYGKLMVALCM